MSSTGGAQLVKRLLELDYKLPPLYFDISLQLGVTDYQTILGSLNPLDGATGLVVKDTVTDSFKQEYKARFGSDPGPLAEYGYDASNLLMKEYNSNGAQWVQNLKTAQYDGASGHVQFDDLGLRLPEFNVIKVQMQIVVQQ